MKVLDLCIGKIAKTRYGQEFKIKGAVIEIKGEDGQYTPADENVRIYVHHGGMLYHEDEIEIKEE